MRVLDALRESGFDIPSTCEAGNCGTVGLVYAAAGLNTAEPELDCSTTKKTLRCSVVFREGLIGEIDRNKQIHMSVSVC